MIYTIFFLVGAISLLVVIDFLFFIFANRTVYESGFFKILEVVVMVLYPAIYLWVVDGSVNDCCSPSASFSPPHRLTIYVWVSLVVSAYFFLSYRKCIGGPLLEVLLSVILLSGFILNIFVAIQVGEILWAVGCLPIGMLLLRKLIILQRELVETFNSEDVAEGQDWQRWCLALLKFTVLLRFPVLFVLIAPLYVVVSSLLMLFGQKPDSIVRAFTETYHHGFSQLDYLCDNVNCGGHFLCSVAANGHPNLVKPIRYGERNGDPIICNRQLLVSNAFEELIQVHFPGFHAWVRNKYNRVGDMVHKHYHFFNRKWVSNLVYVAMKPLEWIFVLILYFFDHKPENRIAQQYLHPDDRRRLTAT
ncbi:MAG: DUF6688 family protein [Chitinophagaceae bacterium]